MSRHCPEDRCFKLVGHHGPHEAGNGVRWGEGAPRQMDWKTRAERAEAKLAKIKAADPELFDTNEDAEEWVYETYGSAGRRLREAFLTAMKEHDEH